jgi:hypothetical protein
MELKNIILSDISSLRRPRAACSPSYADCRPKTTTAILLWDMGYTKVRPCKGGITQGKETKRERS